MITFQSTIINVTIRFLSQIPTIGVKQTLLLPHAAFPTRSLPLFIHCTIDHPIAIAIALMNIEIRTLFALCYALLLVRQWIHRQYRQTVNGGGSNV